MEFHQLRYFAAVVEAGSFGRAAEICHVAQPSLSQQIRKLEEEIGERLFDRLGRRIAVTSAGKALYPRARRVLRELEEARRCVRADAESGRGELSIGIIPTIAPYLLPGSVRRFRKILPEAELTVEEDVTDSLLRQLSRGELDLGLMSAPVMGEKLATEEIAIEPLLVALPQDHELARRKTLRTEQLEKVPLIALHRVHCLTGQVQEFCVNRRIRPKMVYQTTQLATVLRLVELGMGAALIPQTCAASEKTRGIVFRELQKTKPKRTLIAVWNEDRLLPSLAKEFVAAFREECARVEGVEVID